MDTNRRGFLRALVGGVAVAASARTFPFRVYSFSNEIQPARGMYQVFRDLEQIGLGHIFYNLEGPAKLIYPVQTPLLNRLPIEKDLKKLWTDFCISGPELTA